MEEWAVVGGKGRAKKAGACKQEGRHEQEGTCKSQPLQPEQAASIAPLPGWGYSSGNNTAPTKPRRGRNKLLERTPEQVASDLLEQVKQFRQEVEGSSIFASLQHAFATAAPHLPVIQHQGPARIHSPSNGELGGQSLRCHYQQQQQQQQQDERMDHQHRNLEQQADLMPPSHGHPAADGHHANWQHIKELVVFGLGSMQESITSRYQLALASLLASRLLPGLTSPPIAFDPAFSPADALLLTSMGFRVLETNQQCAHRAHVPTLFYLPHLEGHLCNNLLAANGRQPCIVSGAKGGATPNGSCETSSPQTGSDGDPPPHMQHHQQCHKPHQEHDTEGQQQQHEPRQLSHGAQQQPHDAEQQPQAYQQPCHRGVSPPNEDAHQPSCTAAPHTLQTYPTDIPPQSPARSSTAAPHTLHNCLLLSNRFSTYECRCPGPSNSDCLASNVASMGGGFSSRSSRIKAKKRGQALLSSDGLGMNEQGAHSAGGQNNRSQSTGGSDSVGAAQGLQGLMEGGHTPTMLSLLAAGAVLEFQVKEDKRFPAPSAFNDMALHVIPLQR